AFVFAVALFFRFANPSADCCDHRLDLGVFEKLVFARFLNVDEFSADWKDRLVTPVTSLFCGSARRVTLDNVEFGQLRIALRTVGQFSRQTAAGKRSLTNGLSRLSGSFARSGRSKHLFENAA